MSALRRWQRVGIILSVLWLPAGFYFAYIQDATFANHELSANYELCNFATDQMVGKPPAPLTARFYDLPQNEQFRVAHVFEMKMQAYEARQRESSTAEAVCSKEFTQAVDAEVTRRSSAAHMAFFASLAFAPVIPAWLLAFSVVGLFRWVKAGPI
jgi:hypothetical protein